MDIFDAIENDCDIDAVLEILKRNPKKVRARNRLKDNPLHYAAWQDCARIVQILLDHGASINARGDRGKTALHYAAYHGSLDSIRILVKAGADLEAKDDDGRTPLQSERDEEASRLLLRLGAKVDPETAIRTFRNGILSRFLKNPRMPKRGREIAILLETAVGSGNVRAAKMLLARGADPNVAGYGSRPPLIQVVSGTSGSVEIVQLLIDHGADVNVEILNQDPQFPVLTPMVQAMRVGFAAAVEILRRAGAKEPTIPIPNPFIPWYPPQVKRKTRRRKSS